MVGEIEEAKKGTNWRRKEESTKCTMYMKQKRAHVCIHCCDFNLFLRGARPSSAECFVSNPVLSKLTWSSLLLQEVHRSLLKILRMGGGRRGLSVARDAWKKGMAMEADGDAGNRWGNNGKVAVGVCGAVLAAQLLPANLPGTGAELAGGGGRRRGFAAAPRGRDLAKLPPKQNSSPRRSWPECSDDLIFHYACTCSPRKHSLISIKTMTSLH